MLNFPFFGSYDERAKKMDRGYPQRVESAFPKMTGEVTAAHISSGRCFKSVFYKH